MWQQLKNKGGYDNNIMIAGSKEISQVISQQLMMLLFKISRVRIIKSIGLKLQNQSGCGIIREMENAYGQEKIFAQNY